MKISKKGRILTAKIARIVNVVRTLQRYRLLHVEFSKNSVFFEGSDTGVTTI